jgi:hypothetical protein
VAPNDDSRVVTTMRSTLEDARDAHAGYLAGLRDSALPSQVSEAFELGWYHGAADRDAGAEDRFGSMPPWVRRGVSATVPRGTIVRRVGGHSAPAGRTYVVTIDHVLDLRPAYVSHHGEFIRPGPARIVWAGAGGYWADADAADIRRACRGKGS